MAGNVLVMHENRWLREELPDCCSPPGEQVRVAEHDRVGLQGVPPDQDEVPSGVLDLSHKARPLVADALSNGVVSHLEGGLELSSGAWLDRDLDVLDNRSGCTHRMTLSLSEGPVTR